MVRAIQRPNVLIYELTMKIGIFLVIIGFRTALGGTFPTDDSYLPDLTRSGLSNRVQSVQQALNWSEMVKQSAIRRDHAEFDSNYLRQFRNQAEWPGYLKAAQTIAAKWATTTPTSEYICLISRTIRDLLHAPEEPIRTAALALAGDALARIEMADPVAGDTALVALIAKGQSVTSGSGANEQLDRNVVLAAYLSVFQRVEEEFSQTIEQAPTPARIILLRLPDDASEGEKRQHEASVAAAQQAQDVNWMNSQRETFWRRFGKTGEDRRSGLERDTVEWVKTQFSMAPADLQIVKAIVSKNIREPALLDRLIRGIYDGQNPLSAVPPAAGIVPTGSSVFHSPGSRATLAFARSKAERATTTNTPNGETKSLPLAVTSPEVPMRIIWFRLLVVASAALLIFIFIRSRYASRPSR